MQRFSLNIRGKVTEYTRPVVMGILNVTPDSFYEASRSLDADEIKRMAESMLSDGADIIDVGAYSTRPGHSYVSVQEEIDRLGLAILAIFDVAPGAVVSVDTFRADVAEKAVKDFGAAIINDISGGVSDELMFETVAKLRVPYILTHNGDGRPEHIRDGSYDNLIPDIMQDLADKTTRLRMLGTNDIIVDPGFGFGKDMRQNYQVLQNLHTFCLLGYPLLVGFSRKSMITNLLGITPEEAANGTTALNMAALDRGASILRVHDVRQAVETVKIYQSIISND